MIIILCHAALRYVTYSVKWMTFNLHQYTQYCCDGVLRNMMN